MKGRIYFTIIALLFCISAGAVSLTSVQTNVSCAGGCNGAATVTPAAGTAPYTFSWSPSGGSGATASGLCAGTYTCTVMDATSATASTVVTITQPTSIITLTSQVNLNCNGVANGSATVAVSGGTGTKTYSWAPSGGTGPTASGLAAGNYTVTVTDANACTATRTFSLTQPPAINMAGSQTNVSCNGGSNGTATVNANGGTGAFSYSWAPSGGGGATASGLSAGTYTVTVTDGNSCTATRSYTLTQPATAITSSGSQTNLSCNGGSNGSATVTPSGGGGSYTYSWSPSGGTGASASGLSAGNYTVTITDANSCSATRTFSLTQPPAITTSGTQTNISCSGGANGSAGVTPSGGATPYTYSWSPSGGTGSTTTGRPAGNYTVTVTDANTCTVTRTFTLTQPVAINVSTSQTNISCNGLSNGTATVTPSGGVGPYTYSWSPGGGSSATTTGRSAGTYTVTITDANSCTATRNFTLTQPIALSTSGVQTNILCNGDATGSATVTASGGSIPYTYSWSPLGGPGATTSGRTAGSYTVTVTDANSCTTTRNFTLTQPTALTGTTAVIPVACYGASNGTITLTPSGGVPSYTYNWGGGVTTKDRSAIPAGSYSVVITDGNGCTKTVGATVTQPATASTTWLGLDTNWINAANWSCGLPTASTDVVIDGTGVTTMPVIATTVPTRNITFANGGSASFSAGGWLEITGNTSGSGLNSTNGGIRYTGSSLQTGSGITAAAMEIANSAGVSFTGPIVLTGDLSLSGAGGLSTTSTVQVGGTLTLTNGLLTLGSGGLSAATLAGGGAASYIKTAGTGTVTTPVNSNATVTFPVGRAAYNPVTLFNTGNSDDFAVRVYSDVTADGTEAGTPIQQSVRSHVGTTWMVDDVNNAGAVVAMTLQFNNGQQDLTYYDPNHTYLAHFNSGIGKWEDFRAATPNQQVAVVSPGVYSVTNTVSNFSPFTVTSGGLSGSQPLPVVLAAFGARNEGTVNKVSWQSLTEHAVANYEVMHSADGRSFASLGSVVAKGEAASYNMDHQGVASGMHYYRLRIVGTSGESEWSNAVAVAVTGRNDFAISLTPHPVTEQLNVAVSGGAGSGKIALTDMTGTVLQESIVDSRAVIDMRALPAGVYFLRYSDAGHRQTVRVVKQ